MKLKLTWLMTLFMACLMSFSFAQEKTVTGTVTSAADGLPLPGVTILVKNTSRGQQTDFDGNYSIQVSTGDVLVFTYVGTKKVERTVGANNVIDITLKEDAAQLEEVVITGYAGATNSSKVSSAIATVSNEKIEQVPINSLDQVLQGNAAGVQVSTGSGQPGQSATIIIRGRASLNGDIEPLFVIDGIPVDQDNFRSLNQNDIASLSVLKDAASTAIYGNRGAGGVILVTTKRGKKGSGMKVQYRGLYGYSENQVQNFEVFNTTQRFTFLRDIVGSSNLTDAQIAELPNTDWTEIFFRTGITQSHELNVTTGGENMASYTSVNYYEQEGTTLGSQLQRFSVRSNLDGSSKNGKFNYGSSLTVNYSVSNFVIDAARGGNTGGELDNPFIVPYIGLPQYDAFNPDGSLNIIGTVESGGVNADGSVTSSRANGFLNTPFIALNTQRTATDRESEIKSVGSVFGSYRFADSFTVGGQFGLDYTNVESLAITDPESIRGSITPNAGSVFKGAQGESFFRDAQFTSNAYLRYDKDVTEKLNVNAAIFTEYIYRNIQNAGFTALGLIPSLLGSGSAFIPGNTVEGQAPTEVYNYIPGVFSTESELALLSYFGTLDLDWDNKYGFSASVRRDGTSRFVESRWGTFWSVSGRWNIDNESFMENVDWVNILKIRASYGIVGSQSVGSFYQGTQRFAVGPGYQLNVGRGLNGLVDEGVSWEETAQFNVGLSFGLFQSRLTGELDYYNNLTTDLFGNQLISNAGTGYGGLNTNIAEMRNSGVDLQINLDILRKSQTNPWSVSLFANGNYNDNVIEKLPGGFTGNTLRNQEGRQALTWFFPRWAGVDPSNGQPLYYDVDGNITNQYSPANGVYLDKNLDPNFTGGFGADISYKGFSFNTLFSWEGEHYRENQALAIVEDIGLSGFANLSTSMLDAWTTPGQITDIPAPSFGGLRAVDGDRYLENASFLRWRNATLAYNFSGDNLENTPFTGLRIFVQGTNLITWTNWRGFDPEGNAASAFFDFPISRTISFGMDLTF